MSFLTSQSPRVQIHNKELFILKVLSCCYLSLNLIFDSQHVSLTSISTLIQPPSLWQLADFHHHNINLNIVFILSWSRSWPLEWTHLDLHPGITGIPNSPHKPNFLHFEIDFLTPFFHQTYWYVLINFSMYLLIVKIFSWLSNLSTSFVHHTLLLTIITSTSSEDSTSLRQPITSQGLIDPILLKLKQGCAIEIRVGWRIDGKKTNLFTLRNFSDSKIPITDTVVPIHNWHLLNAIPPPPPCLYLCLIVNWTYWRYPKPHWLSFRFQAFQSPQCEISADVVSLEFPKDSYQDLRMLLLRVLTNNSHFGAITMLDTPVLLTYVFKQNKSFSWVFELFVLSESQVVSLNLTTDC